MKAGLSPLNWFSSFSGSRLQQHSVHRNLGGQRTAGSGHAPLGGQAVYKEECKSCHGVSGVPPERAGGKYAKIKTLGDSGPH